MNHHFIHPVFHSLYARLTLWVMLTVIIVFAILTLIITLLSSSAVLVGSTENAQSRMEIANKHINSVLVSVEVAVENTVPEVEHSLGNPEAMYDVVRRVLELNPTIIGSTVAFEPNYYPSTSTRRCRPNSWAPRTTSIITWTGI